MASWKLDILPCPHGLPAISEGSLRLKTFYSGDDIGLWNLLSLQSPLMSYSIVKNLNAAIFGYKISCLEI